MYELKSKLERRNRVVVIEENVSRLHIGGLLKSSDDCDLAKKTFAMDVSSA